MMTRSRRTEQTEGTRRALLDSARALFTERGYADVSTEEIVRRARVTRGALYHHFRGKEDLFRAVLEELNAELGERAAHRVVGETDPWNQLRAAAQGFLDAAMDPAVQRIALVDAPSVLGWETWRELDEQAALGMTELMVGTAMQAGAIVDAPLRPLAQLLLAALNEGAIMIARASDGARAREEVGTTVDLLLAGLRPA
jgi:AcrR family transcriptional regulator